MSFGSNAASQVTGISALTANNDWQIDAAAIEIVKRADGSDWLLGDGAFGKVPFVPYLLNRFMMLCIPSTSVLMLGSTPMVKCSWFRKP